ncbi:MAG: ScyD/ScyE family protein [Dehalococcoidia bacterium]
MDRKRSFLFMLSVGVMVVIGALAVFTPGSVSADTDALEVIASGLDNPRGLEFGPDGALYVAEAGRGGEGPCAGNPESEGEVCYGPTGAITRVHQGEQERVAEGLPSLADETGGGASGPHDISLHDGTGAYVVIGLGADPAERDNPEGLGETGLQFGQLVKVMPDGSWSNVADLAAYEGDVNPDGAEPPDSNPYGVLALPGKVLAVDAGGNTLLQVDHNGDISTVAVFPDREIPLPPEFPSPPFPDPFPLQSVPTSVAKGPDGAYYVGELTGFPFPPDEARVYRVAPGEEPEVYAEGFTNIIDLAFGQDGSLYVLEIAANSLISEDMTGALIRVSSDGSQEVIASEGLVAPAGLTSGPDGALYVSNCGVCPGEGEVVRIDIGVEPTDAELINDSLGAEVTTTTFNSTAVAGGDAGAFTIEATFTNTSSSAFTDLFFHVAVLEPVGKKVLNCDDGPDTAGCRVSVPSESLGDDGVLDPGESFTMEFEVGLDQREQFEFFVNAYGVPGS